MRSFLRLLIVRKEIILLIIIAATAFRVVYSLPVKLLEPDDQVFSVAMQAFSQGKLTLNQTEYGQYQWQVRDLRQYINIGNGRYAFEKPPFYAFFLSALYKINWQRFANIILAALALCAFYVFMSTSFSQKAALISSIILLCDATFIGMLYRIYMDDFASMAFVLIGTATFFIGLNKNNRWLMISAGFVLAISVGTRYTNIVIYLAILIYLIIVHRKDMKALLGSLAWLVLGSTVPAVLLGLYHFAVFGSPFTTGYSRTIGMTQFIIQFVIKQDWTQARRLITKNFLSVPRLLLEGFPSIVLLPAGIVFSKTSRTKYPVRPLLVLWFLVFFLLYSQYMWLRWDSYIYQTRFYLPFVPVLSAAAGLLITQLLDKGSRVFGYSLLALLIILDISIFSHYIATQVYYWNPVQR